VSLDPVMMENTLQAWAKTALGLADVIWSHPNQRGPDGRPYGWLTLSGPVRLDVAATTDETNLSNPAGQEIERTVSQHEEWTLVIEVLSKATSGAGTARAILAAAGLKLQLPSALEAVRAAGLAPVDFSDTQDLTALFGTAFESRARMDVRLRTVNTAMEKTGYIKTVGLTSPFGSWTLPL